MDSMHFWCVHKIMKSFLENNTNNSKIHKIETTVRDEIPRPLSLTIL